MNPDTAPVLQAGGDPPVTLRPVRSPEDLELLRTWKNANRASFFHQEEILPEQQAAWFAALCEREDDFMFVVEEGGAAVGCMGVRALDGTADVYNVIRGRPEAGGRGVMSRALAAMVGFARLRLDAPVTARVLRFNPAVSWYRKNGFVVGETHDTYYVMTCPGAGRHEAAPAT